MAMSLDSMCERPPCRGAAVAVGGNVAGPRYGDAQGGLTQ
jgi:hypothetical protein